jgi:hypothetical protein
MLRCLAGLELLQCAMHSSLQLAAAQLRRGAAHELGSREGWMDDGWIQGGSAPLLRGDGMSQTLIAADHDDGE